MTARTLAAGAPDQPGHPLISVVIPCYNGEPFIEETIRSVLGQTHSEVEVIVVDDASTDGSWRIIQGFAGKVLAIRLRENAGASHARNRGAEMARGAYLMFLDADDHITPDTLAAQVAAVERVPFGIAIVGWKVLRKVKGGRWESRDSTVPIPSPDPWQALREWMAGDAWVPPCAVLWRRDAYLRTGGWDEGLTFNDDGDLMMRALLEGARLVKAEGGAGYYRSHGDSRLSLSTDLFSDRKIRSGIRVYEKLAGRLEERGLTEEYAIPLGIGFQRVALFAFQHGHTRLAREALARGVSLCGPRAVSPTALGRLLDRLLGLERKERVASWLGRIRVMSPGRRVRLRRANRIGEDLDRGRETAGGDEAT